MKHIYSTTDGNPPKNIYIATDNNRFSKVKKAWRALSSTKYVKVWDITEDKWITKIYIAQKPKILWYQIGECYDISGLVVKAVWSDGVETDITDEIQNQLPVGIVSYSELASGTYVYTKRVTINYETSAGTKTTWFDLTINPYYFDMNCVFNQENGATLVPTLFFDNEENPQAIYYYDIITSTTNYQSTNFTKLFIYTYPKSVSARRIRITNCNAKNINKIPFITKNVKYTSIQIGYYLERIEKNAFSSILDSITLYIPRTVKFIGTGAFANIDVTSQVYVPDSCEIETGAFPETLKIVRYERENDFH